MNTNQLDIHLNFHCLEKIAAHTSQTSWWGALVAAAALGIPPGLTMKGVDLECKFTLVNVFSVEKCQKEEKQMKIVSKTDSHIAWVRWVYY